MICFFFQINKGKSKITYNYYINHFNYQFNSYYSIFIIFYFILEKVLADVPKEKTFVLAVLVAMEMTQYFVG